MANNLQAILARAKAKVAEQKAAREIITKEAINSVKKPEAPITVAVGEMVYNAEQTAFINLAAQGKDCVLVGAAGTGKTTSLKGTISKLLSMESYIHRLATTTHKYLRASTPGIVAASYTRRSVNNLRRAMPTEMKHNCITLHKLLEFQPIKFTVLDPETGEERNSMRFEPTRHKNKPLDSNIKVIVLDEAGTISLELFNMLLDALQHEVQFIFLGDIQQLPPVFGVPILGVKGSQLEDSTIELTQVYRQALESPIIRLAHRILSGVPIPLEEYKDWHYPDQLTIHPWKKKISADNALLTIAAFFKAAYDTGKYNKEEDMILIPFNKSCGTDELNKHIANHIAKKNNKEVYEIIAGYEKCYFSVGDIVMFDKEDAVILNIAHNGDYSGRWPQSASTRLDYWGHKPELATDSPREETVDELEARIDSMLAAHVSDIEEKTNSASHTITIRRKDSDVDMELSTSAAINSLALGYAITVHKSQGSEWRKVFFIAHQSHATMLQRELLYTAVTRAREELYIICEPETFTKGIINQRIKGETLKEKFAQFRGRINSN